MTERHLNIPNPFAFLGNLIPALINRNPHSPSIPKIIIGEDRTAHTVPKLIKINGRIYPGINFSTNDVIWAQREATRRGSNPEDVLAEIAIHRLSHSS